MAPPSRVDAYVCGTPCRPPNDQLGSYSAEKMRDRARSVYRPRNLLILRESSRGKQLEIHKAVMSRK